MAEDWTFDITQVKTTEIKAPLGFNSSEINVEDSKSRRQEINRMKENKAWGLVTGQGRSIFTTFISSFFIGTNVSMFTLIKLLNHMKVQNIVYSLLNFYILY